MNPGWSFKGEFMHALTTAVSWPPKNYHHFKHFFPANVKFMSSQSPSNALFGDMNVVVNNLSNHFCFLFGYNSYVISTPLFKQAQEEVMDLLQAAPFQGVYPRPFVKGMHFNCPKFMDLEFL